ncbi:MAG: peptide deformylase [Candidatus Omnitrophica bacterium]|nr:peptide deformylase [Candidatus Omnitrophota bacterium]
MQLKVRLYGDSCLTAKSKPVKEVGPAERMLIASMFETMRAQKGIGLAAPQVGINEQIFVVDTGKNAFAVINPKILRSVGSEVGEEGCLSIPFLQVSVKRAKEVEVEFIDENNELVRAKISGLLARVFQHENDHLYGKLITDYLTAQERRDVLKDMKDGVYSPNVEKVSVKQRRAKDYEDDRT